jgi:hypothetical protein
MKPAFRHGGADAVRDLPVDGNLTLEIDVEARNPQADYLIGLVQI